MTLTTVAKCSAIYMLAVILAGMSFAVLQSPNADKAPVLTASLN
ncbi:hypothetical protein [Rhizobium halophytocola]|uniref:Uncharacterized protein n=1 Tax=Rhizobium halophytocola TaxID=735519 RepID=A0ABS4DZW6_9HYPH|nr:hypothetical protein [Rhizobium halophytocola]MBP1851218.1 hypothetical protein [Rhizobium halophytocola]